MTLDEIFEKENISVRSYNVCKDNGLTSVEALKAYYNKYESFLYLKNCGRKTNEELIGLCKKYFEELLNSEPEDKRNRTLKDIVSNLTGIQREVVNRFILGHLNRLSEWSIKAISNFLQGNFDIQFFAKKLLFSKKYRFNTFNKYGGKSISELEEYVWLVKQFVVDASFLNTEKELLLLIEGYERRMSLDEIFEKENISVRAYNLCIDNKLTTVKALGEYFYKNRSFFDLRNCGKKTNEELTAICEKYIERSAEIYGFKKENPLEEVVNALSRIQREVINSFISVNTNSLSVRSRNAITSYLEGNLKIKNFAEKILLVDGFRFMSLNNVGAGSIAELNGYLGLIKDFLIKIKGLNSEKELISLKNKYLIQRAFSIDHIPYEILESESIFMLINFLLRRNVLFGKGKEPVLKKVLHLYADQEELTLTQVAESVNLSRERVRQLRNKYLDQLFGQLLFIRNFKDDLYQNYNIDKSSSYIDIDDDVVEAIKNISRVRFSRGFITYILYVYLSKSHSLVGNTLDVLAYRQSNSRARHNWDHLYIVRKDLCHEVDFEAFANDVSERLSERINQTYSFNLKSYLSRFLTRKNINVLSEVVPFGEKILNDEFDLYLDLNENITFKRNTPIQAYEYAFEALEELGEPSKVQVIYEKIVELYPNYETDKTKVRASMKRKDGFVPIGRTSVFGLEKWEDELDGFKGGTIREIVREYLSQFSVPKHISDVTEHVLIYRPKSNQNSILYNLKQEESGVFVFYEGSLLGLSIKKYGEKFIKFSEGKNREVRTWEESFETLKEFIAKENLLPYSSSDVPYNERRLYRWLNIQKQKIQKGKLDADKVLLIEVIVDQFSYTNERRISISLKM